MAGKRERRLRRKARQAARALARDAVALLPIARIAIRYVDEIYAPNIKEPFSIINRRPDLVDAVRAMRARRAA